MLPISKAFLRALQISATFGRCTVDHSASKFAIHLSNVHAGDRPYLVSGADDKLAKVWDYQTKACVQTLEGHSHNVSAVCFHPELPVILTGYLPPACPPSFACISLTENYISG